VNAEKFGGFLCENFRVYLGKNAVRGRPLPVGDLTFRRRREIAVLEKGTRKLEPSSGFIEQPMLSRKRSALCGCPEA
jgi:hypothetical protein